MLILVSRNTQKFRYIAPVFGPMYLLGGFGLSALLQLARRYLSAIASYRNFESVYVKQERPDLSIKSVLDSNR